MLMYAQNFVRGVNLEEVKRGNYRTKFLKWWVFRTLPSPFRALVSEIHSDFIKTSE